MTTRMYRSAVPLHARPLHGRRPGLCRRSPPTHRPTPQRRREQRDRFLRVVEPRQGLVVSCRCPGGRESNRRKRAVRQVTGTGVKLQDVVVAVNRPPRYRASIRKSPCANQLAERVFAAFRPPATVESRANLASLQDFRRLAGGRRFLDPFSRLFESLHGLTREKKESDGNLRAIEGKSRPGLDAQASTPRP